VAEHSRRAQAASDEYANHTAKLRAQNVANSQPPTPDKKSYEIEQLERIGPHLVLRVRYPNCMSCAWEGNKIMVFLDVPEAQALKWREIDPHFRDPAKPIDRTQAPSPAARFPASIEGWEDAVEYAQRKARVE
jgi:hypothetical protein